jgi:PAS domain S-box-containing protein
MTKINILLIAIFTFYGRNYGDRVCRLSSALILLFSLFPLIINGQSRDIRIGVYQNEPKIFMDKEGRGSGLFIELLSEIAVRENWNLIYIPCEWSECLDSLESGNIDLMPDVAYDFERDSLFDFHKIPVIESWSRIYVSPKSGITKISDLDGKRIAVLKGSVQQTVFEQLMTGFGYKISQIPAGSFEEAFSMVENDSADAAAANHLFGDYFYQKFKLQKTTIDFHPSKLYFAVGKKRNTDLLEIIDQTLNDWIPKPGSSYYTTLGHWTEKEPFYRIPQHIILIISVILGLLIIALTMVHLLRRRVRIRTKHLKQAHMELLESEQRYQTLTRISPVGIFHTDSKGSITYVNPKWCEISGLSFNQALADGWLNAVHPDDRQKLISEWKESAHLPHDSLSDYRFVRSDGTITWVMEQVAAELNSGNKIIGFVGVITDITGRKLYEEKIQRLNTDLEQRVEERTAQLQAANKELESFSYSVSHDLRAPLRAISGFSAIIDRRHRAGLDEEGRHYLDNIIQGADRMKRLIEDLLSYARLGQKGVRMESIPLNNLLNEIKINMNSRLTELKGKLEIQQNIPLVKGNQTLLSQVFTNLLENAFTYFNPVTPPRVVISYYTENSHVVIRVSDNGIGIPQESRETIFKIFQRLHSEKEYPGTGIGLATVKKSVELLGGSIWVESMDGKGSTFFVRFLMG